MKKLLFDVDSIIPFYTKGHLYGVGRSTFELINALNKVENIPFELILYSQNVKGIGAKNITGNFNRLHFYIPRREPFNRLVNLFNLKRIFSQYDLMHIPHNTDDWENIHRTIYTIHDLIVYRYPEMWGLTDKERQEHRFIADNCKAIVTCSEASKRDIIKFWGCPSEKITVIPWGVNRNIFSPDYGSLPYIALNNKEFFFCPSCNHPRKQASLVLKSFKKYKQYGGLHKLVMLGPAEKDITPFTELIERGDIIVAKGVDDVILARLYSKAKATVVVSIFEGFGLPVIESLACHTQVICACNSSLIEAGGTVVEYLTSLDEDSLCQKFFQFEKCEKTFLDIQSVEEHLKNFTWEKCAEKYVKFWNRELNN